MGKSSPLAEPQLRALARLKPSGLFRDVYLAGGTAVAYHVEHRQSRDIDLFTASPDTPVEAIRRRLVSAAPEAQVVSLTDVTLSVVLDGTAIDCVSYPYPLLEAPLPGPEQVPVAGLLDLATMKLAAVARRGLRRDFWDLYVLMTRAACEHPGGGEALLRETDGAAFDATETGNIESSAKRPSPAADDVARRRLEEALDRLQRSTYGITDLPNVAGA